MPPETKKRPPTKPPPPAPQNHNVFDPWNSASTGHQRADNPYSNTTAWRDTRAGKLARQFRSGDCARPGDDAPVSMAFDGTCGSQSPESRHDKNESTGTGNAGEWKWVSNDEATRSQLGVRDIRSFMGVSKRKASEEGEQQQGKKMRRMDISENEKERRKQPIASQDTSSASASASSTPGPSVETVPPTSDSESKSDSTTSTSTSTSKSISISISQIFIGTTIFINGSTLPQISDHKLKHLLVSHGAQISISMARKTVSHVIIGQPGAAGQGAGGGLAARKLQQEIARGGWKGVRVVGVDWVLESIKTGKRLAESRFAVLNVAPKGQRSVVGMFGGR